MRRPSGASRSSSPITESRRPHRQRRRPRYAGLGDRRCCARSPPAGYACATFPAIGDALIARLLAGPTNAPPAARPTRASRAATTARSSRPCRARAGQGHRALGRARARSVLPRGRLDCGSFAIPAIRCGNVAVALQPSRGYNIDPQGELPRSRPRRRRTAISPSMPGSPTASAPTPSCIWASMAISNGCRARRVALSAECFPEAALGPLPHLYPFIVNDPGEGTQAKRRAQAVIIDHLTPPLTRAESYGRLAELELLVDEYYAAAEQRSAAPAGAAPAASSISSARERARPRLRHRRGRGRRPRRSESSTPISASSRRCRSATGCTSSAARPRARSAPICWWRCPGCRAARRRIKHRCSARWRAISRWASIRSTPISARPGRGRARGARGRRRVAHRRRHGRAAGSAGPGARRRHARARRGVDANARRARLDRRELRPAVRRLRRGRDRRPAARPRRPFRAARPVRRAEPRPARRAADRAQFLSRSTAAPCRPRRRGSSAGNRPRCWSSATRRSTATIRARVALSAWGTSNMRTGGDDVAQALGADGRAAALGGAHRPRHRLRDHAVERAGPAARRRHLARLGLFPRCVPEPRSISSTAPRAPWRRSTSRTTSIRSPPACAPTARALEAAGVPPTKRARRAGYRVFGSKPGAYGAGLGRSIDEGGWEGDGDLAAAYLAWGGYAYGGGAQGDARANDFRDRLGAVDVVLHNQDNREHDILDSDDYYQFMGGLAATVRNLRGRRSRSSITTTIAARRRRASARLAERSAASCAAGPPIRNGSPGVMRHGYKGGVRDRGHGRLSLRLRRHRARSSSDHHFDSTVRRLSRRRARARISSTRTIRRRSPRSSRALCRSDPARAVDAALQQRSRREADGP